MVSPFDWLVIFLSRLYGGEQVGAAGTYVNNFLSRLYGGEHSTVHPIPAFIFLSRLYGGERGNASR